MSARLVSLTACSILLLPQLAQAGPKEEAEAYKTLGKSAFEAGNFAECARQYRASYERVAEPKKLFNVGLCSEKAEHLEEALEAYREYLKMDPQGPKAPEVQTRIELLVLKIKSQATQSEPVVEPKPVVEPQPATTPQAAVAPQPVAAPSAGTTPVTTPPSYMDQLDRIEANRIASLENLYMALNVGGLWATGDQDGPLASLDFRGNFGFNGVGFMIGLPLTVGLLEDPEDDEDYLFFSFGADFGLVIGGPRLAFFATTGPGMIVSELQDDTVGFDLRATLGLHIGISRSLELRTAYKRHVLDGLNVFGLSLGYRFHAR